MDSPSSASPGLPARGSRLVPGGCGSGGAGPLASHRPADGWLRSPPGDVEPDGAAGIQRPALVDPLRHLSCLPDAGSQIHRGPQRGPSGWRGDLACLRGGPNHRCPPPHRGPPPGLAGLPNGDRAPLRRGAEAGAGRELPSGGDRRCPERAAAQRGRSGTDRGRSLQPGRGHLSCGDGRSRFTGPTPSSGAWRCPRDVTGRCCGSGRGACGSACG